MLAAGVLSATSLQLEQLRMDPVGMLEEPSASPGALVCRQLEAEQAGDLNIWEFIICIYPGLQEKTKAH